MKIFNTKEENLTDWYEEMRANRAEIVSTKYY